MIGISEIPSGSERLSHALAFIDGTIAGTSDETELLHLWKCRGLIRGYDARWSSEHFAVDVVEQIVTSELWNPESGRKSRSFTLAGKIDATANAGRRVVIDHKTTSDDITDSNAPYWRQLAIEGQVSHYMLLEWLNGRKVDEAVWDVMRKPSIAPKAVAKADVTKVLAFGQYCGESIAQASLADLAATGRETLEMYSARLAEDCTTTRPEWYFQRRTVPRTDADLHEYAADVWDLSQELLLARRANRWPRNPGACMLYGRPCSFLGICAGHDTPESDNWRKKSCVHTELQGLEGDGRDVLTTSRLRCFQTCRRKHYLSYELGIERQMDEESDALRFGTLWHSALEIWFQEKGDTQ